MTTKYKDYCYPLSPKKIDVANAIILDTLKPLKDSHGLLCEAGKSRYSFDEYLTEIKVNVLTKEEMEMSPELLRDRKLREEFEKNICFYTKIYKGEVDLFGKVFYDEKGKAYRVTGFNPNAPKYSVIAVSMLNGSEYRFTHSFVSDALKKQGEEIGNPHFEFTGEKRVHKAEKEGFFDIPLTGMTAVDAANIVLDELKKLAEKMIFVHYEGVEYDDDNFILKFKVTVGGPEDEHMDKEKYMEKRSRRIFEEKIVIYGGKKEMLDKIIVINGNKYKVIGLDMIKNKPCLRTKEVATGETRHFEFSKK